EPGYGCEGEPSTCGPVYGDTCNDAVALTTGTNVVAWTAVGREYITAAPSCSTTAPTGPDLVMSFTASVTGELQFSIDKPTSQRWHLVVSDGACGTLSPEIMCLSEYTLPEMAGIIPVTQGTTYWFYLVDSTSGTAPLNNPLTIDIVEAAEVCGDGVVVGHEGCDDGNTTPGDGCSDTCAIETGYGDTCAFPISLTAGTQTIGWDATGQDVLTAPPSCSAQAIAGPDLVMAYTATMTGQIQYQIAKPASTRWHLVVSDDPCGTTNSEVLCHSDFTPTSLSG